MISLIKKECTSFSQKFSHWQEVIESAGRLLEKEGCITHEYTQDMINIVNENGPYIVVMPGIALAHARPEGHVYQNAISVVTLKDGLNFGHSTNDPVKVLFAVAAKTDEDHLKLFQKIADFLMSDDNIQKIKKAKSYEDVFENQTRIQELEGGLIVSCYADQTINAYMDQSDAIRCVAQSCVAGGAKAIRTNLEHVKAVKKVVQVPVIGIKKIYKGDDELHSSFRITPTMKEVDQLVEAGADGIAIDATKRERYDNLTLEQFVQQIKMKYPHIFVVGDISTLEEGKRAYEAGVDAVGTTLSGYTSYSKNPILFGTIPSPDPDYEIIKELKKIGIERVIAEGRVNDGHKMGICLDSGAFAVVIGTSISEPKKIVKTILYDAFNREENDENI